MSTGGTATCTSSEFLQTAAAVTAIASASSDLWQKLRIKVDTLRGLSSGTQMALGAVGLLTGVGADKWDVGFIGVTGGKYQMKVTFQNNSVSLTSAGTDLQSALPANGNYLVPFIWYSTTLATCGVTLFDDSGNSYAAVSGAASGAFAAGGGLIVLNDCNIVGFDTNQANTYNGTAIYTSVPPTSGSSRYAPPVQGETGQVYLSWMNDAPGSTGAAAQVGSQALANNGGSVTYTGNNGSLWGPAPAGLPTRHQRVSGYSAIHRASRW
jgi:hypothetical protein